LTGFRSRWYGEVYNEYSFFGFQEDGQRAAQPTQIHYALVFHNFAIDLLAQKRRDYDDIPSRVSRLGKLVRVVNRKHGEPFQPKRYGLGPRRGLGDPF
jgi:hypothetical protein